MRIVSNIVNGILIVAACAGLAGCYNNPPPPPPPRQPKVTLVCKTNVYGERVCTRTVSRY